MTIRCHTAPGSRSLRLSTCGSCWSLRAVVALAAVFPVSSVFAINACHTCGARYTALHEHKCDTPALRGCGLAQRFDEDATSQMQLYCGLCTWHVTSLLGAGTYLCLLHALLYLAEVEASCPAAQIGCQPLNG
jgi:hypothetical protein